MVSYMTNQKNWMRKLSKKLSDRIVAKLWGTTVIADDKKVEVIIAKKFKPLPKQEYLGEIIMETHIGNGMGQKFIDPIIMKSAITHPDSDLMIQYEKETGKHAVWGGRVTKQFIRWMGENVR